MGLDIIEQNAPAWERGWSEGHRENQFANLFTAQQKKIEYSLRPRLNHGVELKEGTQVLVSLVGERLQISDGIECLGYVSKIPAAVVDILSSNTETVGVVRSRKVANAVEVIIK